MITDKQNAETQLQKSQEKAESLQIKLETIELREQQEKDGQKNAQNRARNMAKIRAEREAAALL